MLYEWWDYGIENFQTKTIVHKEACQGVPCHVQACEIMPSLIFIQISHAMISPSIKHNF